MNTQKQEGKGRFVQYPLHLIYGCPDLTRDDKWVLLAIMGECWTEGPHKLSYRDISRLSGVPISLLSSIKGKEGKPDKEGIIDRLVRMGFIKVTLGKEIKSGKPCGNAQTYIHVNHKRIWEDNVSYCEAKRSGDTRERYRCEEDDFKPVSYTNRLESEPVRIENEPVSYTNTSVPNTNRPVSYTNEPVRDVSSKVTPYITDIKITKDKEEEGIADESTTQLFAPDVAPSPTSQSSLSDFSEQDLVAEVHRRELQQLEQTTSPIAIATEKNIEPMTTRNARSTGKSPKRDTEPLLPIMPLPDAPWSKETAVRIVEAKKGRAYSQTTRKQELAEAGKVLEMAIDGVAITREQFESAWDELASSSWWDEHGKPCMIKYLRRDDAIVGIIKKLKSRHKKSAIHLVETGTRPSFLVSEEQKQKNIEKLRTLAAAKAAKE